MGEGMRQDEARARLAAVDATQERLIERVAVPAWYWWLVAVLMVALGLVVDGGRPAGVALAAVLFALLVAAATGWVILRGGRVQVSRRLLGGEGTLWILGFVWLVVGVSLAVGFALRAAGSPCPATVATLVGAIGVAGGGPVLMRELRRTMLRHRTAR